MTDTAGSVASILDMARVLQMHKAELARGVRFAWWTGHSFGRYAGLRVVRRPVPGGSRQPLRRPDQPRRAGAAGIADGRRVGGRMARSRGVCARVRRRA